MSAYGAIGSKRHEGESPLPTTSLTTRDKTTGSPIVIDMYHLTLEAALKCPGLVGYLHSVFAQVVEDGRTYPMEVAEGEKYSRQAFESYFFAADVIVGLLSDKGSDDQEVGVQNTPDLSSLCKDGQPLVWEDIIAGFYYVKPNYPGRSSHICNAGFVVPPNHWNKGYGRVLANSYLHYAPKLGYQASVFNLVYVNNTASIKLWDALGFTRAGLIPNAGRLRKGGGGEEYIDAIIYYKSFIDGKR